MLTFLVAYHLAYESVTRVPKYRTQLRLDKRGNMSVGLTKEPTVEWFEVTHRLWRCGHCRGWLCAESPPKVCGKCHA